MKPNLYDISMNKQYDQINRECLIDNVKVKYDVCSSDSLENAKLSLSNFKYIGSSTIYFINGCKNNCTELTHFFIKN